jgi:TRAP-type C4-dicarboxylate transport system permease small subunit
MDAIVVSFVWTVILAACYAMRCKSHVKFTMIYDGLAPKPAAVSRCLGNLLILATFASLVYASFKYSLFVGFQKTAVFRIPYTFIFMPFVYYLVSVTLYTVPEIIEDIRIIAGIISDSSDHAAAITAISGEEIQ